LDGKNFWNGGKFLRKKIDREKKEKLKNKIEAAAKSLANFLLFDKFIPEQKTIVKLAEIILKKYDEIKFREKIFTHNDIIFYTYEFLHSPEFSIIDRNIVLNVFYEQLTYQIRFVLIDEFQDTSILQWNILFPIVSELISGAGQKDYGGVIIVGDEKQSIFGWRGGERELLTRINKLINLEKNTEKLSISYRSNTRIIQFLNDVFGNKMLHNVLGDFDMNWEYSNITSNKKDTKGYIELHLRQSCEKIKARSNKTVVALQRQLKPINIYEEFFRERLVPLIKEKKIDISDTAILARTNNELDEIAHVCDEFEISYIQTSSFSLFSHKTIKPIIQLLKFIVYDDIYELISFLRSDIILMHPRDLKKIMLSYKKINDGEKPLDKSVRETFFEVNRENPIIQKIALIDKNADTLHILQLNKKIIEEFRIFDIFSGQTDIRNIQRYLEIVAEFDKIDMKFTKNLKGFLEFFQEVKDNDEYSQVALAERNALQLLTIHKSKGLEFDTVITFFHLKPDKGQNDKGLKKYFSYDEDFTNLAEIWLTYNFAKIIKKSSQENVCIETQKKKWIEILNNYYVALSRAKSNLFIYAHFDYKFETFLNPISAKENLHIPKLIFSSFYKKYKENFQKKSDGHFCKIIGDLSKKDKIKPDKNKADTSGISAKYFSIDAPKLKKLPKKSRVIDYKKTFLQDKKILKGNIAHFYLSLIYTASDEEFRRAFQRTVAEYGGLLNRGEIRKISEKANRLIHSNKIYYDTKKWDNIFNEYTVFDSSGKEYRLDRMMVNKKNREVFIIDYKTGEQYDENQVKEYIEIVKNIPNVRQKEFSVNGCFLEI